MNELIKSIIDYEYYIFFFMIFTVLCFFYENKVGLFVSIIAFLTGWYLKYTDNYSYSTMFKVYLVIIPTIIMFLQLNNFIKIKNINLILRTATQANIAALIFSEHNFYIICVLILSILTTPYFAVKDNIINMKQHSINPSIWVIMTTIILTFYYSNNLGFSEHKNLALFCIWIPTITYFLFNRYLSVRGLLICCWFLFDLIDKKNLGI